jgi:hypothetical protein
MRHRGVWRERSGRLVRLDGYDANDLVGASLGRLGGDSGRQSTGGGQRAFLRLAGGELDRAHRLDGLLLGDARDAEDATQEALPRASTRLGTLSDPAAFRPWFRLVVDTRQGPAGPRGWQVVARLTP